MQSNTNLIVRLRALSQLLALLVIGIGILVMAGWIFNIALLKSVFPDHPRMKFNTALAFIMSGSALLSLQHNRSRLFFIFTTIVMLIGGLTMLEHIFGWDLHIDQWLVSDVPGALNFYPGRISPATALNFCLVASSLLLIRFRSFAIAYFPILGVILTALLSVIGYFYNETSLYSVGDFASVAFHTAVTFILVNMSILCLDPEQGLLNALIINHAGGRLARRMLLTIFVVPILLGWLWLKGQEAGFYGVEFGFALYTISTIVVFTAVTFWTARLLNRIDAERGRQEEQQKIANDAARHYAKRLAVLHDIDRGILEASSVPTVIEMAVKHIRDLIPCQIAAVILFDTPLEGTVFAIDFNTDLTLRTGMTIPLRPGFVEEVRSSSITLINETLSVQNPSPLLQTLIEDGIRSLLRARLFFENQVIGFLSLSTRTPNFFTDEHGQIAAEIANQIAIALHQFQLSEALKQRALELEHSVADLRQAEMALRQANEQLETRVRARTQELTEMNQALAQQITQRKRAEDLFRALLESAPDPVVIVDANGQIVLVNAQTEKMFGYTRLELIGQRVEILIPERFQGHHPAHRLGYTAASGIRSMGVGLELYAQRKDGSQFPVEISLSPIDTPDGLLIASSVRDITQRKQVEMALRQNEETLQTIFNVLPVGLSMMDANRKLVRINQALEYILELPMNDLIKHNYSRSYIHPDGTLIARHELPSERAFTEQKPVLNMEVGVIQENGARIWTSVSAAPLPNKQGVAIVTVDVTARKLAEDTLRESEERFRQLVSHIKLVFWMASVPERKTIYVSPAFEHIWGQPSQYLDEHPDLFLEVLQANEFEGLLTDPGLINDKREAEYQIVRPDGNIRWIRTRVFPIHSQDGTVYRIAGVTEDITDQKEFEVQTFELALEREQMSLLSNFIRDTSHDIRTPLTIISTNLYLLKRIKDPQKQADKLELLENQVEVLNTLIGSLHTMSNLDAVTQLKFGSVDINRLMQDLSHHYQERAAEKHQTLTWVPGPSPLIAMLDQEWISQALRRILDNALLYTPDGGQIHMTAERLATTLTISVSDTGIGIDEKHISKIFERFYKVNSARTSGEGGSGIGLSLVKKIVQMHGGQVNIESTPGQGSTFSIVLPIAPEIK